MISLGFLGDNDWKLQYILLWILLLTFQSCEVHDADKEDRPEKKQCEYGTVALAGMLCVRFILLYGHGNFIINIDENHISEFVLVIRTT